MKLTTEVALEFYTELLEHFQLSEEVLKTMNFTQEIEEKLTHKIAGYLESYDLPNDWYDRIAIAQAYLCIFAYVDSHSAGINPIADILEYAEGFFSKKLMEADLCKISEGMV